MAKWIGKGVLKVDKDTILKYGDDIPKSLPKARLAELEVMGLVGDIMEVAKATPFDNTDNSELEASHRELMAAYDAAQKTNQALTADKDFVIAAFNFVQDLIDQIVKTEPNREIKKILNMEG